MSDVTLMTDGFVVDAAIVGAAFGVAPADVPARLRAGTITSRCETGVEDDAGRWRLTFYAGGRALRLVVDAAGEIQSRATFPVRARSASPYDTADDGTQA